jgi:hypothetical protein
LQSSTAVIFSASAVMVMKPKGEGNDRLEIADSLIGHLKIIPHLFLGMRGGCAHSTLGQKLVKGNPLQKQRTQLIYTLLFVAAALRAPNPYLAA